MISPLRFSFADSPERPPVVLIAEDDVAAAEMLSTLLTRVGYQVRLAPDGAAALRLVEEPPHPDMLLLDWMLPEISGLDVCRAIRKRWDALRLPILMVTAKTDAESISAAFAAGASDYLTKPFLGAELRARVAAHLRIKRLSDEHRALDEHLIERDKLSTLGLFVSGVAHDLNNPLAGISGYAQLLREEEHDPERLGALERILSEVQRCNRIVADLLSFARRHSPARARVEVGTLLNRTLELRERHLQSRGIWPDLQLAPDLPALMGDEHQLQQVFLNLLINAEQALRPDGGTLRISAERVEDAGAGPEGLDIHFFNDGPAIPEHLRARIFDPFFTTKGKEEGTGLGLAICRRIVREHGGDISLSSDSCGTTFTLRLPSARATTQRETAPHLAR